MTTQTMTSELKAEKLYHTLTLLGHKVLLKNYECPLGEVDFITKKDSQLWFIGVDRDEERMKKAGKYYIKRYGIEVKMKFVNL